jgi:hypothetical protein
MAALAVYIMHQLPPRGATNDIDGAAGRNRLANEASTGSVARRCQNYAQDPAISGSERVNACPLSTFIRQLP